MKRILKYGVALMLISLYTVFAVGSVSAASSPHSTLMRTASASLVYGCKSAGCYGKDPVATNCNQSALTLAAIPPVKDNNNNTLATGNNVYSVGCNANWSEGTLTSFAIQHGYSLRVVARTPVTPDEYTCFPGPATGSCANYGYTGASGWPAYSNMVDGTHVITACISVIPAGSAFGVASCVNQ